MNEFLLAEVKSVEGQSVDTGCGAGVRRKPTFAPR